MTRCRTGLRALMLSCAMALAAPLAQAATTVAETEPNDSLAAPQMLAGLDTLLTVQAARSFADPSDDFFRFQVRGAGLLSIWSESPDGFADSVLGLYDPGGRLVASNDNGGGNGFMSALEHQVGAAALGWYTVGFSGFNPGLISCTDSVPACYDTDGDFAFDTFVPGGGAGGSTGWDYNLNIGGAALVPEPGTFALLALALPLLAARCRRLCAPGRPGSA